MQNDYWEDDYFQTVPVRAPVKYIEKKVYVTDAGTAVMVIEEIRQLYKNGLFHTDRHFDGDRFEMMLSQLIRKYKGGEIK